MTLQEKYKKEGIFEESPFLTLHPVVKESIRNAVEHARAANPDIEIGICGEHGADPASITYINSLGFKYTSCAPFSVAGARVVAAQNEFKQAA